MNVKRFFQRTVDGATEYHDMKVRELSEQWGRIAEPRTPKIRRIRGNREWTSEDGVKFTLVDNEDDGVITTSEEDDGYWSSQPHYKGQKIRLVREKAGQGKLYQGRIQDCEQFTKGLHFHLGHYDHASVDGVVRVKYTISDGANMGSDWVQVMRLASWAVTAIKDGHDVFVTCDMGASRSVTFTAMIVSLLDDIAFDTNLRFELRNHNYDEPYNFFLPNYSLWREAAVVVEVMRDGKPTESLKSFQGDISKDANVSKIANEGCEC